MDGDSDKVRLGTLRLAQRAVPVSRGDAPGKCKVMAVSDHRKQLERLSEKMGIPAVDLDSVQIELRILEILPREIAEQYVILPFAVAGDNLNLAMEHPEDSKVIEEIEFVSGKKVFPHVALPEQIRRCIELCYDAYEAGETTYTGPSYGRTQRPSTPPPQHTPYPLADKEVSSSRKLQAGTVRGASSRGVDFSDSLSLEGLDIQLDVPLEEQLASLSPVPPATDDVQLEPVARKKILVVDDEEDIRTLITRILLEKGYDVVAAGRGLEALKMVQDENPDMIILDAMLPEVHGFDICRKIKGSKKYGHIPVIMISAIYRGWRYAQDLKDSYGVDDFIEKPFKLAEFLEKVHRYLEGDSRTEDAHKEDLTRKTEEILAASIAAYKEGNLDKAIDLLRKGVEIDPLAYKLHYNLGLLLGKKSLNYQAIRELESTLELEPNYFPAMKNLALLYQKAGFKFKAIETWERSLHYCPDEETRQAIKKHLMDIL